MSWAQRPSPGIEFLMVSTSESDNPVSNSDSFRRAPSAGSQGMKPVLFVLRLNSALVSSLRSRQWRPEGMPAVCKLLEFLEREQIPFDVALVDKSQELVTDEELAVEFPEFSGTFYVVPSLQAVQPPRFLRRLARVREFAADIQQTSWCLQKLREKTYGLVYVDRTNLIVGGLLSRFSKHKVFLRLHGVIAFYDYYKKPLNRLLSPAQFLSFSAPYAQILCTQDGTAGDPFLSQFKNPSVPHRVILNGVEVGDVNLSTESSLRAAHGIEAGTRVILFTGRLESSKGADKFLEARVSLANSGLQFKAILVGGGSQETKLRKQLEEAGIEDKVVITGAVPHAQMSGFYNLADIYVSLNVHGNLSNCVLESVASGASLITFKPSAHCRDDSTYALLGDRANYIDRDRVAEELPRTIKELLAHPEKLDEAKQGMKTWASENMSDWDQRLGVEAGLIRELLL